MKNKDSSSHYYVGDVYTKIIIIISIVISLFFKNFILAAFMFFALILSYFLSEFSYRRGIKKMRAYLDGAAMHVGASESMPGFPFPAASITEKGKITWYNSALDKLLDGELLFQKNIRELVKDFDVENRDETGKFPVCKSVIKEKTYAVHAHKTPSSEKNGELILIYFLDITEYQFWKEKHENERFVSMTIAFDNYEEVMQGLDDEVRNKLQSSVERSIANMATEIGGVLKKTERDRYSLALCSAALDNLIQKKFPILDTVREIQIGNSIAPTLSIGIGIDGKTFLENDFFSRTALDMALGRGGDQAVLKNKDSLQFYGGKTREVERRTKVKARVVALAMQELIRQSDSVVIIGHKNADVDCIGAAMGIVAISRSLGKQAHILQYEYDDTASAAVNKALEVSSYKSVFIRHQGIKDFITSKTLLMVVDTNSLSYLEGVELLELTNQIVLIDHHRKSSDSLKDLTLAYHEPYASSTCEMITEMLPYLTNKNILLKAEAEALYAGIYLDTKCFTFKTGVRTLEAAAYLRRAGIDPVSVKQFFKNNLETFTMKAALIQNAKVVKEHIAISVTEELRSSSVVAQAADELLNIADIETSFVISKSETGTIISGRSTGRVNVQVILESLGGGGHFSVAGAQLKNISPVEAEQILLNAINEYFNKQ